MNENKTSRYLKYAIGEIILVVIGILIAVQINNWNQDRNRAALEKVLLKQLKEDMLLIYNDIYTDFNIIKSGRTSHYNLVDYIENDVQYNDSMCFDFYFVKSDEYIYPAEAIYSRIKEEGLDIIKNDSIRSTTQFLYETIFPRLSRGNNFNPDISQTLDGYYLNHFKLNVNSELEFEKVFPNDTLGGEVYSDFVKFPFDITRNDKTRKYTVGFVPLDFEALKKDHKFRLLLEQTERYRTFKGGLYGGAVRAIHRLTRLIDEELSKSN
jgi:hypothetical protein